MMEKNYKKASKNNWGKDPCGSNTVSKKKYEYLSKEYFEELDRCRFRDEPWMKEEFGQMNLKGKKVLEVGYGMGRDHIQLAKLGGELYGIDITEGNYFVTTKHLEVYGYSSNLLVGDAESLPYENNTFDFVYSFGVLHHTPNMEKSIDEIYRVLKPGGKCWIGLYNKNSWFYKCYIVPLFFIKREYMTMSLNERMSMIEYPNQNKDILVRLTTKQELKKIFSKFQIDKIKTKSLNRGSFIFGGKMLNDECLNFMQRFVGWYNIVEAHK